MGLISVEQGFKIKYNYRFYTGSGSTEWQPGIESNVTPPIFSPLTTQANASSWPTKAVFLLTQGGERTSQSRDQNIEIGYTLRNFLSLRTRKINFFNTSVVPFRKIASAKCETDFKPVIIAYLII